jgi:hypothetical protein
MCLFLCHIVMLTIVEYYIDYNMHAGYFSTVILEFLVSYFCVADTLLKMLLEPGVLHYSLSGMRD